MRAPNRIIPSLSKQDILRFQEKVHVGGPDECWLWTASCLPSGYGSFGIGRHIFRAHRIAWTITNGPIPSGLCVLHSCDNPPCQNPRHLFTGTQPENIADMVQKGRQVTPRGDEHWLRKHPERILRGEQQGRAKLTEKAVHEIRAKYAAGDITQTALAHEYGVGQPAIGCIVRRTKWTHI